MRKMNKDAFLKNKFTFGLILRADIEDIEKIKKLIATVPDVVVIYQTIDAGPLWIKRGPKEGQ